MGYESGRFFTRKLFRIAHENTYNLGYWSESDPQHPSNRTNLQFTQADNTSESEEPLSTAPNPIVTSLAAALTPVVSLQVTQPLNAPLVNPTITPAIIASAIAQPPPVTAPPANPPAHMAGNPPPTTGSLRGVPPNVFTGNHSRSEAFLNKFRRYRLLNKNNEVISNPFTRVLTALSYIKGPIVEDWVNAQDRRLERRTDTTTPGHMTDTDEVLWTEFETAFKDAWRDGTKNTDAYDQLMKLKMKDLDVDTYIATFERLVASAEWEPDAKATISRFRLGLQDNIHRRVINRETWPANMAEWKEAARKEVNRTREIISAGLDFRSKRNARDFGPFQTGPTQRPNPPCSNNGGGIVPMDVDTAAAAPQVQLPFKKLTDEERVQFCKEGKCFRCRQKGHMARECPGRALRLDSTQAVRTSETTPAEGSKPVDQEPTTTARVTTVGPKLTKAQQIVVIEESMDDEERGAYLDARDMGQDFYDVET